MTKYVLMVNIEGTWLYIKNNKGLCFTDNKNSAKSWVKDSSAQNWWNQNQSIFESHLGYKKMMISEK